MWRAYSASFALAILALLGACEEHECLAAGCSGGTLQVVLLDDTGSAVAAAGELRTSQRPEPREFDCTVPPSANSSDANCYGNRVSVFPPLSAPGTVVEVRFDLPGRTQSEWQTVELAFERHTDPDFNGPGCGCTWYEVTAQPVVVPVDAQLN